MFITIMNHYNKQTPRPVNGLAQEDNLNKYKTKILFYK